MKKASFLFLIISVILVLFLCSCGENQSETVNTDTSDNQENILEFDVTDVRDFRCEIVFGQTNEEYVLEGESAKELYNIIISVERTNIEDSQYSSMNQSTDYIYLVFTGDSTVINNMNYYGYYQIYTKDVVVHNLSPLMSHIMCFQFEGGFYNEVKSYIENHIQDLEA